MSGRKIAGLAPDTWLRWAAALALAALGMIAWSILDPSPIPIIVSMSIGQGLGTLSLLLFLFVVFMDLRSGVASPPPPPPEKDDPA